MGVEETVKGILPGVPEGDPGQLHAAADAWRVVANGLRTTVQQTRAGVASHSGSWTGEARAAFDDEWGRLAQSVESGCDDIDDLATNLDSMADGLHKAQLAYEVVVGAAGVIAVVGVISTVVTLGASAAATVEEMGIAAAEARTIAEAAAYAVRAALARLLPFLMQLPKKFLIALAIDITQQGAVGAVTNPGHNPLTHISLRDAAVNANINAVAPGSGSKRRFTRIVTDATRGGGNEFLGEQALGKDFNAGDILLSTTVSGTASGVGPRVAKLFQKTPPYQGTHFREPGGTFAAGDPVPAARAGHELPAEATLKDKYVGENDSANPDRWTKGDTTVKYMNDAEREAHRVVVGEDGALYSAADGSLLDTHAGKSFWSAGKGIFVMDDSGNLYVTTDQKAFAIHHSTLSAGQPVVGAGEIDVTGGRLRTITDRSGHYTPSAEMNDRVLQSLFDQGLVPSPTLTQQGVNPFVSRK